MVHEATIDPWKVLPRIFHFLCLFQRQESFEYKTQTLPVLYGSLFVFYQSLSPFTEFPLFHKTGSHRLHFHSLCRDFFIVTTLTYFFSVSTFLYPVLEQRSPCLRFRQSVFPESHTVLVGPPVTPTSSHSSFLFQPHLFFDEVYPGVFGTISKVK